MRRFTALSKSLSSDLLTPLGVYLRLAAHSPYSFLLESFQGGESWGRYSFIGLPATEVIRAGKGWLRHKRAEVEQSLECPDPLAYVQEYLAGLELEGVEQHARFGGGLVGYFAYDCVRYVEPRLAQSCPPDDLELDDVVLMLCTEFVVFDNVKTSIDLVKLYEPASCSAAQARARLEQIFEQLKGSSVWRAPLDLDSQLSAGLPAGARYSCSQQEFERDVLRVKDYISAGDVMQAVPSQRLELPYQAQPIDFYRALRHVNPSPYMYFFNLESVHIAGASPEVLARLEPNGRMTLRPIAGTRPRAADPVADAELERELLADAKEIAEHIMLIDLARNDLGKIAVAGSVRVDERMRVERYSHVMHIVSNTTAQIKPGHGAIDLLRAAMPAGTLSGAPKIRAMEIIDELERCKRGVYAGAIGYIDLRGSMDMAIPIRTGVITGDKLYLQCGAGIVFDSDPEREWQETISKQQAMLSAYKLALASA